MYYLILRVATWGGRLLEGGRRNEKSTFATDELMQTADRQLAGERGDSEFMRKTVAA